MSDIQGRNNVLNRAQKYTVAQFNAEFPDDDACIAYIMNERHPGNILTCEKCKVERKHYRITGRKVYGCDHCGTQISPLAGTIFEKSSTSLKMWFHAMFQMGSTKCGISAKQIQRETGVTYKTAWRMFKQIRTLMSEDVKLEGDSAVEVDEMYHGGKAKNGNGRRMNGDKKKTPVFGMVERGGKVVARTVKHARSSEVFPIIKECVLPMSTIYSDEAKIYDGVEHMKNPGYRHRRINHSQAMYVMGDVHTNTLEGFWSLIKRGLSGTHHSVSAKYLQEYLNEYSFRYNRRSEPKPMFRMILDQVSERAE